MMLAYVLQGIAETMFVKITFYCSWLAFVQPTTKPPGGNEISVKAKLIF